LANSWQSLIGVAFGFSFRFRSFTEAVAGAGCSKDIVQKKVWTGYAPLLLIPWEETIKPIFVYSRRPYAAKFSPLAANAWEGHALGKPENSI